MFSSLEAAFICVRRGSLVNGTVVLWYGVFSGGRGDFLDCLLCRGI